MKVMIRTFDSYDLTVDEFSGLTTGTRELQVTCRRLLRTGEAVSQTFAHD